MARRRPKTGSKKSVFVSHYIEDWKWFHRTFGKTIEEYLDEHQFAVYMPNLKINLGADIRDTNRLGQEIRSDVAIILLSNEYIKDSWLMAELASLLSMEKSKGREFIIPVYKEDIKDSGLDRLLSDRPRVTIDPKDPETLERVIVRIEEVMAGGVAMIFVSHSSADSGLAKRFVDLLETAIDLEGYVIRCTSAPGYTLETAANVDDRLRIEVYEADLVIALITRSSIKSVYVLFELGARWGAQRPLLPLLAGGVSPKAPLDRWHAPNGGVPGEMHGFLRDVAKRLNRPLREAARYDEKLRDFSSTAQQTRGEYAKRLAKAP
jgi:TIR domain